MDVLRLAGLSLTTKWEKVGLYETTYYLLQVIDWESNSRLQQAREGISEYGENEVGQLDRPGAEQ